MRKIVFNLSNVCLLMALMFVGCQKVEEDIYREDELEAAQKSNPKNECRLIFATNTDPTFSQNATFHYNERGLADKWDIENYGLFTQEYDEAGNLIKSVQTIEDEVILTILFFYTNGKVSKDILYAGTSKDKLDETFYTYDVHGRMVKVQSYLNDYVTISKYSPAGNMLSNEFSYGGVPFYSQYFSYNAQHKNPFLAVPGISYNFPYYLPASPFYSKWRPAGIEEVVYAENGDPIRLFKYDPSKTIWNVGHQNYVRSVTYFDESSTPWEYSFEYENCGPASSRSATGNAKPTFQYGSEARPLLQRFSMKPLRVQIKEIREALKNNQL